LKAAVVLVLVLVAVGCTTGPYTYSFEGSWQAAGGALDGVGFNVTQRGDSVYGCAVEAAIGTVNGNESDGKVRLSVVETSSSPPYVVPLFVGHFVNASTVVGGTEYGPENAVTLTRSRFTLGCYNPF
jgi:hypothetical protein